MRDWTYAIHIRRQLGLCWAFNTHLNEITEYPHDLKNCMKTTTPHTHTIFTLKIFEFHHRIPWKFHHSLKYVIELPRHQCIISVQSAQFQFYSVVYSSIAVLCQGLFWSDGGSKGLPCLLWDCKCLSNFHNDDKQQQKYLVHLIKVDLWPDETTLNVKLYGCMQKTV